MSIATRPRCRELELAGALARIAAAAGELDSEPRFPQDAFAQLAQAGALGMNLPERAGRFSDEVAAVRRIAAADSSVGRIFDGHLNAIERLRVAELLDREQSEQIDAGRLLLGVWGADPAPGEGPPARLARKGAQLVVNGVKTFCSGAGGVDRALVVVADSDEIRRLAYVELSDGIRIDTTWYRAAGLRASESHRVQFTDARVIALLGGPNELARQPYFARDALRTAASWAGIADRVVDAAIGCGRAAKRSGELAGLAVGRLLVMRATIDHWLARASVAADGDEPLQALAIEGRWAIAASCREILAAASELCGSRPLVRGEALDRASRDLSLFLLQHRLDPLLARHGAAVLKGEAP